MLGSIFFVNELTGYVCGQNGVLKKTTNGGEPIGIKPISGKIPVSFSLHQNYPNPFNPVTNILFDLPERLYVRLSLYNTVGQEVLVCVNEVLNAGSYKFELNAENLTSGVYFYRLSAGDYAEAKKMILVK